MFTSAGLVSVVVGIAAQATLGNVFAGLQLAFSDSIRMGDIVIWEEEFTTVEEITLTYVVLKVWDGRRLIVPSKEMTSKTFENWTRRAPVCWAGSSSIWIGPPQFLRCVRSSIEFWIARTCGMAEPESSRSSTPPAVRSSGRPALWPNLGRTHGSQVLRA